MTSAGVSPALPSVIAVPSALPGTTELLDILACPRCGSRLRDADAQIECSGCGRRFPIDDGVPVFLEHEEDSSPSLAGRVQYSILGNPRVYDFHQKHFGGREIISRVARRLESKADATVLDIGAGTGALTEHIPSTAGYVWLDNDRQKLQGFLGRNARRDAVLADATALPISDRAVETSVLIEVSHHLDDESLDAGLREIARVTTGRFLLVDALRGERLRSNLMWRLDLGGHPRTEADLLAFVERRFVLDDVERFRINHDHILCVCVPRRDDGRDSLDVSGSTSARTPT